ncbi:hypothetical protein G6F57_018431 [Rhizopus arrhizus]|uniref:Uncharacterized protein n=1 Tax=Rhizopus oryzae TaxID=64495 RepID=A0A9P6WV92_RHIOR|nr:hypothetical protein G6F42_026674 [Rhizopus arrhizus]KAG1271116.1 hypothetical protein G6F66_013649 [Rhizopus arrhizus]KAG1293211.1 hypothetical protein G6F64_013572 [Rhizopus arrhizus]KAG1392773.1 hypothetical protein G6F59_014512 [Rhizopus arrhizus]KAG1442376.1 hypothetical protein G6F57_018431 [Rhizopus arrhizus]
MVKTRVKKFTRSFGRQKVDWRKQQIVALQRKRQRLLRGSFPTSLLAIHLPRVEQQIQTLQQEITSIAILKAERSWRERGETDAGYLKKSATSRLVQRSIPPLMNPANQTICSSQDQMLAADLSKNRKEQERTRLDKEIALFNKKMILYLYFSYTDNISCYGLIINEYDITDDK